ncbi:MAG: sulfite exporter TauE/SafE family protein [Elusimicrobia bacterium]|nr:sulfite exporter TauE/SafE family protein [Elusimicrobiota bacterium]
MKYLLICSAALLTSGLTLFSGFGLGTLLMPVFAIFFPVEAAVGLTAVVHFLNNLFKLALLGKHADRAVVLRFGIPAILAAFLGARALVWLSHLPPLASYAAFGKTLDVLPVKLAIGLLMIAFALLEIVPAFEKLAFDKRYLPAGGVLSGFFGGLSGNQGALRSAFLIRCGLSKEGFIATGVVIACLVDVTRLGVYATKFSAADVGANAGLLTAATLSAFVGAWGGNRLLHKITIRTVQWSVAAMLLVIAVGLAAGLI